LSVFREVIVALEGDCVIHSEVYKHYYDLLFPEGELDWDGCIKTLCCERGAVLRGEGEPGLARVRAAAVHRLQVHLDIVDAVALAGYSDGPLGRRVEEAVPVGLRPPHLPAHLRQVEHTRPGRQQGGVAGPGRAAPGGCRGGGWGCGSNTCR